MASRNKFKVNDKVTPVDPSRNTYGHTGIVTHSHTYGDVVVQFPHLKSPATFDCANLRLAGKTKQPSDEVYVVIYNSADDVDRDIVDGDINSSETKEAIAEELRDVGIEYTFIAMSREELDEELDVQAGMWCYVYGLINGKPFRITTIPVIDIAD